MFSIYTVIHTIPSDVIDYKAALDNFCSFADEVCVATTLINKNDKTVELLEQYQRQHPKLKFVITKSSIYSGSGEMKNEALKICTEPFCILLDLDERIRLNDKPKWIDFAKFLNTSEWDAFLIPSIDLFNTEREYRSIGYKWYLAKNIPTLFRGVVDFARKEDGTVDTTKSDSSELIYADGKLCKSIPVIQPVNPENIEKIGIKIFHLGWLDKEKRLKGNDFSQIVFNKLAGNQVSNIIHSMDELNQISYWPHGLKLWYE